MGKMLSTVFSVVTLAIGRKEVKSNINYLRLWGLSYYTEPRLSIRVNTCGDGGGRSGKTDIISLFFNEGGFSQVAEW